MKPYCTLPFLLFLRARPAVAADKRRRMSSSDDFPSNGSRRAPLGPPSLPRFVSRGFSGSGSDADVAAASAAAAVAVAAPGNEGSGNDEAGGGGNNFVGIAPNTTSRTGVAGPDGAAGAPIASERDSRREAGSGGGGGGGASRRNQAKIRRAMVLAVQNKANQDGDNGILASSARRAAGHVYGSTGGHGGGGAPGIFAAARPTSFGVSRKAGLGSYHSAGEEYYRLSVGGGGGAGAHHRSAIQGDDSGAVNRRVRLTSIGSVGSAGDLNYSRDRSALGGPGGNVVGSG